MIIGEADDHVESKDPGADSSGNAVAGSSPDNADVFSPTQIAYLREHSENALQH